MKKLYYLLGLLFVFLGIIGIFIPVWPTTPFVLLAMFLFSKSNKNYNDIITRNKWVGHHIENYFNNRSMSNSFKLKTILFLWTGLTITMFFQSSQTVIIVLLVIGTIVSIHIAFLKKA